MIKLLQSLHESKASDQAHKLGLTYKGYGFWTDGSGKVVAQTVKDNLVKVSHEDAENQISKAQAASLADLGPDHEDIVAQLASNQPYTSQEIETLNFTTASQSPAILNGVPIEKWDAPTISQKTDPYYSVQDPNTKKWTWEKPKKKEESHKWKGVEGVNPNIQEPPFSTSGSWKAGAGVVVVEPDLRVWLVAPTKQWGGYQNTFPKGTVDSGSGLGLQETAIKEAYEESGLKVQILDFLDDSKRSNSVSRYYIGKRVGGDPTDFGWETEAVRLVPLAELPNYLNKGPDKLLFKKLWKKFKPNEPTPSTIATKASEIMVEKVGEQAGTNEGGIYKGADGKLRYVKLYKKEPEKAFGEVLADWLYRDLNIAAPWPKYFDAGNNVVGFASEMVPDVQGELKDVGLTKEIADKILDGFCADCLVANWDVVGVNEGFQRNIVVRKDGLPVRIDNGGSFLSRGLMGRKDQLPNGDKILNSLTEWDKFLENPGYATVFKTAGYKTANDIGVDRLKQQVAKIVRLHNRHGGWAQYVDWNIPDCDEADKQKMVAMLYNRTKLLVDKIKSLGGGDVMKQVKAEDDKTKNQSYNNWKKTSWESEI